MIALTALVLCAAGQAQTIDICDRTPQVRDAILEAVDADDCAAVDFLAGVGGREPRGRRDRGGTWRRGIPFASGSPAHPGEQHWQSLQVVEVVA